MVKRNFTVATCGLKPEIADINNTLSRMENEISSLKSELSQVKKTCGSCVHREGINLITFIFHVVQKSVRENGSKAFILKQQTRLYCYILST